MHFANRLSACNLGVVKGGMAMAVYISRGGVTARNWYAHGTGARISNVAKDSNNSGQLVIDFNLPDQASYRTTQVKIELTAEEFENLANQMFSANPDLAVRAFGRALAQGLPQVVQP